MAAGLVESIYPYEGRRASEPMRAVDHARAVVAAPGTVRAMPHRGGHRAPVIAGGEPRAGDSIAPPGLVRSTTTSAPQVP